MMTPTPQMVRRIEYAHGMVEGVGRMDEMDVRLSIELVQPNIPEEVLKAIGEERVIDLTGDFGEPGLAFPVEVDLLTIETDEKDLRLRVFNRGMTLFSFDDDRVRRLHRFFVGLAKLVQE